MKRSIKLLAFLLCLAMTLIPMLSLSASATGEENDTTRGRLAITEINAADVNDTAYQYIEVVNVSNQDVDLSEYYLYRSSVSDGADNWNQVSLERMIGVQAGEQWCARVNITDTQVILKSGDVAVLWLNNIGGPDKWWGSYNATDHDGDGDCDEDDFRKKWNITADVTVVSVEFNHDARYSYYISNIENGKESNSGFLPLAYSNCILQLIHEDSEFEGVNGADGNPLTPATETFLWANNYGQTASNTNTQARNKAADCVALYFTEVDVKQSNVYHFYGYMNTEDYQKLTQSTYSATLPVEAYQNFVTGKKNANGTYINEESVASGVFGYTDKGAAGNGTDYFADCGTSGTVSAGKLANGQFGYNAMRMVGSQSKVDTDSYAVRFVASFEADALANQGVGFDIVATYGTNGEKTFTKTCKAVYSKLGGGVTDGTYSGDINANYMTYLNDEYNRVDEYYVALSVNNIAKTYDAITFEVTPYVIDAFGNKISGASATFVYNDGVLQTNA